MCRRIRCLVAAALIAGCSGPEREPAPVRVAAALPPVPAAPRPRPDRMRVAVRVTAAGLPVAGATVQLSEGRGASRRTATTDRDGRTVIGDLDPGAYELWAESGELASAVVRTSRPAAAEAALALALAPAAA